MNPESEVIEGRAETEARRLMELFGTLARLLGYSNREIERRGKLNHDTATKHFQGNGEPKLEFFLKLVEALGLDYGEFFELAYGDRRRAQPSEAAQRIRRMLEGLKPGPLFGAPEAPAPRKEERGPASWDEADRNLEERVLKVLEQLNTQADPSKVKKFRGKS